jgi:hypothetical protein
MKLKKFMSIIMAVVATSTFCTISALAGTDPEVKLTTAATTVKAGEEFTVDVSIANNPGIVSLYLNVDATNDNFTLVSVEDKKMSGVAGILDTDYTKSEYMLQWWYDDTFSTDNTSNGTVATLTYKVNEGVANGTYAINIACDADNTYCAAGDPIDFGSYALEVKVGEDAPALTAPEVGIETGTVQGPSGKWAAGILGTVNFDPAKNTTFSTIEITPNNGTVDAKEPVVFTVADDTVFESAVTVKCALNITKCPDQATAEAITAKGIVK